MEVDTGDQVRIIAVDGKTVLAEGTVNGVVKRGNFQDIAFAAEEGQKSVRGAHITSIVLDTDGVYTVSTDLTTLEGALGFMFGCGPGGAGCGCNADCGCGPGGCGCEGNCKCGGHN